MGKALSKYYIMTFGCQMNEHDSERMSAKLSNFGLELVDDPKKADVVILNTCSVRSKPEDKLDNILDHFNNFKRDKPNSVIAVTGCVAQQKGNSITDKFSFVDLVLGPDCEDELLDYIKNYNRKTSVQTVKTDFKEYLSYPTTLITQEFAQKHNAYVVAMKGCNSFCSYCIVPYVRGKEHSRPLMEVISDVENLVSNGVSSITLLGQNIAKYGFDNGSSFYELLSKVSKINGLKRLSFLTSHPRDFSSDIIKAFLDFPVMAPMLHLPAQHGSNKILKAMNRGYTREDYLSIIEQIEKTGLRDSLSITTDVIIGFPGETDEDFNDLISLLKEVRYDNSYSFIYSPRPGTKAFKEYGTKVTKEDRKKHIERLAIYHDLQNEIAFEVNKKYLGKKVEVLVEGVSYKNNNALSSRTASGKVVNFSISDAQSISPGAYTMVNIIKVHPTHLTGEVSNDR